MEWKLIISRFKGRLLTVAGRALMAILVAISGVESVYAANIPPTMGAISNHVVFVDQPTLPVEMVIADAETPKANLLLSAVSSDQAMVPDRNIFFGTLGNFRYLTVTPAFGKTGSAIVTVTVSDGTNEVSTNFNFTVLAPPAGSGRFANTNAITIPNSGVASIYPSTIEATGLTGAVAKVELTLSRLEHEFPEDIRMLLVGPTGLGALFFAHVGGGRAMSNVTITVTDSSPFPLPDDFLLISEPLRPANYGTNNTLPAPAPGGPFGTNLATFNGSSPTGTWSLYIVDDIAPDLGVLAGGWSLLIAAAEGSLPPTNTAPTLGAIADQTVHVDQPTLPIMLPIFDTETPSIGLTMTGTSSDTNLVPLQNIFFGTFAPNQYLTVTPAMGQLGSATITVNVSDGTNSASTNFLFTVTPPPPGAARFLNETPITIPNVGIASPYPSEINVSGMIGTVTNLELTLSRINHEFVTDLEILLVSPSGQGVVVFSHVSQGHSASNVTVTLTDYSPYVLPQSFSLWSEPLKPTDWGSTNQFPAPAPAGPYGAVAMSTFNGLAANGTWSLYVYDDFSPDHGAISGGWSLMVSTTGGSGGAPSISNIPNQTTVVNTPTAAIPFTIGDDSTPASSLVLTTSSSNPALVPTNSIVFGGSGSNRTVTLTPAAHTLGSSTITVNVSDGSLTSLDTFVLTVNPAPLTINVNSTNRSYGATNPVFTGSLIGLQPGAGITASFTSAATTNSPVGNYPIVAALSDPGSRLGNYTVTTNGGTLAVTAAGSTNSLVASLNPSPQGANVTFTATVTRAGLGAGQPTGNVQFLTNGVAAGPAVPLAGGTASLSSTTLPVGTNVVVAAYAGDGNFLGSTGSLFQVVTISPPGEPPVVLGIVSNGDGTATIRFGGTPGAQYKVEATTNLVPPIAWTILSTNTAGTNGEWTITESLTGAVLRFYRARPR